ncbi:testis-expressed protein 264 homolog isoform X1 [Betta splendens]|uniref:Testis-expressed protein 264 homolog isoform X1 n=1 Tax=Betta splendens TaxID=158456 RepID=A0A9W2XUG1_BETSP|nr:testis-expressed protein 264 homolog isoform X1 [Betta splendens]
MSDLILVLLIVALLLCLVVTVGGFLMYSGLLSDVVIKTGPPPIRNVTIAYKFKEGVYKECGAAYTESCSIGPQLSAIGVFYDDPKQRPPEKCRYAVGSVLSEGDDKPDEELQRLYEKFGFKVFALPQVSHAVTTSFPCNTTLSYVLGPYRVYPRLASYIEHLSLICGPSIQNRDAPVSSARGFCRRAHFNHGGFQTQTQVKWRRVDSMTDCREVDSGQSDRRRDKGTENQNIQAGERKLYAFPSVEIYRSDSIHYMVPLSHQMDFFVPEMKEEVKTDVKEEESDEDRGTDITGADSHSDVSSVSGGVPWDSRETSLAASTAASLASSLPLRDVADAGGDVKHRDYSDRGSDESMGSGSSFEELDMDQEEREEGEEREEKEDVEEEKPPEGEVGAREAVELMAEKKEPSGDGEGEGGY